MLKGFTVDNVTYDVLYSVKRTSQIRPSDISGYLLDKSYYNDVMGTYLVYTVKMVVPIGSETQYVNLYEVLTNPVPEHSFLMPYNQTTIEVAGRIEVVNDSYVTEEARNGNGVKLWKSITFQIVSNKPYKEPSDV